MQSCYRVKRAGREARVHRARNLYDEIPRASGATHARASNGHSVAGATATAEHAAGVMTVATAEIAAATGAAEDLSAAADIATAIIADIRADTHRNAGHN